MFRKTSWLLFFLMGSLWDLSSSSGINPFLLNLGVWGLTARKSLGTYLMQFIDLLGIGKIQAAKEP